MEQFKYHWLSHRLNRDGLVLFSWKYLYVYVFVFIRVKSKKIYTFEHGYLYTSEEKFLSSKNHIKTQIKKLKFRMVKHVFDDFGIAV